MPKTYECANCGGWFFKIEQPEANELTLDCRRCGHGFHLVFNHGGFSQVFPKPKKAKKGGGRHGDADPL